MTAKAAWDEAYRRYGHLADTTFKVVDIDVGGHYDHRYACTLEPLSGDGGRITVFIQCDQAGPGVAVGTATRIWLEEKPYTPYTGYDDYIHLTVA